MWVDRCDLSMVVPVDIPAGDRIKDCVVDQVDGGGQVRFGISAAFRVVSRFHGKTTGDGGSVSKCLHDNSGAGEGIGNVFRSRTINMCDFPGVASRYLGREGGRYGQKQDRKHGERPGKGIGYLQR